jgi:parallel beta-helix repeat protein
VSTNLFGFKNTAARWICCSAFIVSLVLLAVLGIGKDTPSAAAFDQVAAGAVFTGPQAELRFQSEPTTVTNTADNGAGSLRQAILNAESNAGVDVIDFQISGTGPHIIPLSSSLPSITESVVIDGCSQSGSICNSWPPTLMIVLDGSSLPDGAGLSLESSGSTVSGLVFQNFTRTGAIKLVGGVSTNNWIYTNYIGTNASGSTAAPNSNGIYIASGANGNIIGTNGDGADDAFERNLISGNTNAGILLEFSDTTNNTIAGNWIGTNYSGTAGIGNSVGVWVEQAVGNLIGTNADSHYDTDEGNLISGNGIGILLAESATTNIIAGNLIGTDEGGESDLGNTSAGIKLTTSAYDNVIGGESEAAGNTIAFNKNLGGVFLEMTEFTAAGSGNTIRYNLMSNNAGLGIELDSSIEAYSGAEPNENDEGDSDTGPNGLQNYPVLTSATPEELEGSLNSTPETTLTIDVYASDTCDPSGYGEGAIYVDNLNVVTNTSGYVNFSLTFPFSLTTDQYAVATATDPNGNTSEFSASI